MSNGSGIGYNANSGDTLQKDFLAKCTQIGQDVGDAWKTFKGVLHAEWIGPDEQNFEASMGHKLDTLYAGVKARFNQSRQQIEDAINSWINFENNNTVIDQSSQAAVVDTPKLENVSYGISQSDMNPEIEKIYIKDDVDFASSSFKGLADEGSSANNLRTGMTNFVEAINSIVNRNVASLSGSVDSLPVLEGTNQKEAIIDLLDKTKEDVSTIFRAQADLEDALIKLTGKRYSDVATSVSDEMKSTTKSIGDQVGTISNRWDTGAHTGQ